MGPRRTDRLVSRALEGRKGTYVAPMWLRARHFGGIWQMSRATAGRLLWHRPNEHRCRSANDCHDLANSATAGSDRRPGKRDFVLVLGEQISACHSQRRAVLAGRLGIRPVCFSTGSGFDSGGRSAVLGTTSRGRRRAAAGRHTLAASVACAICGGIRVGAGEVKKQGLGLGARGRGVAPSCS